MLRTIAFALALVPSASLAFSDHAECMLAWAEQYEAWSSMDAQERSLRRSASGLASAPSFDADQRQEAINMALALEGLIERRRNAERVYFGSFADLCESLRTED